MASQEPSSDAGLGPYERGWIEVTRALDAGASWSGHERNVAYLNLGQARFADISALSGLDSAGDGRGVVATDWNQDGALDLWIRNRDAPVLQLMLSQTAVGDRWIELELVGTTCNRDAVGARALLTTDRGPVAAQVIAGDGYLTQNSLRLHFALAPEERIQSLSVRWPGGVEENIAGVTPGAAYRIVQGSGEAQPLLRSPRTFAGGPLPPPPAPPGRIVLRTALPLPPSLRRALTPSPGEPRAMLLHLWSVDCAPCLAELAELTPRLSDLRQAGLSFLPLCVDQGEAAERARVRLDELSSGRGETLPWRLLTPEENTILQTLIEHCLGRQATGLLPTSLLVDEHGWLQVIYLGRADPDTLAADAPIYAPGPEQALLRGTWPGRWFFGVPRDLAALSRRFQEAELPREARFYALLAKREK